MHVLCNISNGLKVHADFQPVFVGALENKFVLLFSKNW
jgi:hypothetical protein